MTSPLRDSRGQQLPVVRTVTSTGSSSTLPIVGTVTSISSSTTQTPTTSSYYDSFRPQTSPPKTETESYYDRYRPHSVSSSNSRSDLTATASASASPTPRSRASAATSTTTLAASSPSKARTGASFRQSPLTDTNLSRMTPGSINYDPLPPSQCPSRTESVASTSTSLLYGMRWIPPAEPSSHNEYTSSAFPPKKAANDWEERKRLMRAATSTPNFTTPSVATAKVAEKVTQKTSDRYPAASTPKTVPSTPEKVTHKSSSPAVSASKKIPVTPKFTTASVATAKVAEKVAHKTSDKSSAASASKQAPVTPEKASTIKAVLRTKETNPKSAPPKLTRSSPLKTVRTASPPQAPPSWNDVTSQVYTIPVTPPRRSQSPVFATPVRPSGPRAPPPPASAPAQKGRDEEIKIPRMALWMAGMSPKTYRNRMAAKMEREAHLPAPLVEPRRETVGDLVLDCMVGPGKVTKEEKLWKQRDLERRIEGLEKKREEKREKVDREGGKEIERLEAKKAEHERVIEADRVEKERRRMQGRLF